LDDLARKNLGIFYDNLVYFMAIGYILWPLEIFYGHLVYFVVIWYIFPRFGILCHEKSGNNGAQLEHCHQNLFMPVDIIRGLEPSLQSRVTTVAGAVFLHCRLLHLLHQGGLVPILRLGFFFAKFF
jgi:hypothetical protein